MVKLWSKFFHLEKSVDGRVKGVPADEEKQLPKLLYYPDLASYTFRNIKKCWDEGRAFTRPLRVKGVSAR